MKMTSVNSIPADTDNTQWPEVIADARTYLKKMTTPYMWAAGLERSEGYKEEIREELLRLVRLTEYWRNSSLIPAKSQDKGKVNFCSIKTKIPQELQKCADIKQN